MENRRLLARQFLTFGDRKVACGRMGWCIPWPHHELGLLCGAQWLRLGAARVEAAAAWRIDWRWHVSAEDDPVARACLVPVSNHRRGEKRVRVRMTRCSVQVLGLG